jgi:hypothetical protein
MIRNACLSLVVLTIYTAGIFAEGPGSANPYSTPAFNPKPAVPAAWNRYHDYSESTKMLQDLAKAHPEFCKLESLGKSYGGREMWVITVTNFAKGPLEDRAAMWIDGAIHANEIQATEVALYTAWYLLEVRGQSKKVAQLLDERVFYIMPMMSPDSRDAHFYEPNTTHSPRSGQRPVDDDKDGLVDEDKADDLDGDGHITEMRVKDPNGRYKPHPDFPSLLIPVKEGEKGSYSLLGVEGLDDDGDGQVNEDADGRYDPNRDWGWGWRPAYIQGGAYRYPFSIGENRMVANFIMKHPHIAAAQSYHNAGGMILRGPGPKTEVYDPRDVAVYDALAKPADVMLPGYRYMVTGIDLYEVHGGEIDWLHQTQGVFTFTNELFTPFNFFRRNETGGFFGGDVAQQTFDQRLLFGDGFVEWHEVDHPQYGKVEVGGMTKTWLRQPPSFLLEEECHRNMAFTLWHADQMPQVRVQSVTKKPLADGLMEVTAIVENLKLIPTHSAADMDHKITRQVEVELRGDGVQVLTALTSSEPFFETPGEQKRKPVIVKLPTLPGHGVQYIKWIAKGTGPIEVEIRAVKGGRDTKSAE